MGQLVKVVASFVFMALLGACAQKGAEEVAASAATETAAEFIARANAELALLKKETGAANWVRATYITDDTAIIAAAAAEKYAAWHSGMVQQALQYEGQPLGAETRRAIDLLKLGTSLPTPSDAAKRKELTMIATELKGMYGAGKYCVNDEDCKSLPELEEIIANSRDYDTLTETWRGWRSVAPPMREKYQRYVELVNEGANELGYGDLGEMWRAGYDMSPAQFEQEGDRLWEQVKPLYDALHCHVRARLGEAYGEGKVPQNGPIPAQLLGNMWSQQWDAIYDIVEPYPGIADLDVDSTLKSKDFSPQEMVRSAESFYVSLGMPRLPDTFWQRSQFIKPQDRDVVCHASAWGLDGGNDLRIKMCIQQTYDELRTIYHELGHNYYQGAYKDQPPLFRGGAHSGFHEAIGDTIELSMTPGYLLEVGLISSADESEEMVINRQMQMALDKIAFLPFGKLIDEWRWGVFSGEISPENYNDAWWDLRAQYQGISPPVPRSEADFDPGAKYHVPANVSYTRYFLARILQFQFQRSLCKIAGHEGDLASCSIFGSKEAGDSFYAMMASGQSEPWQDALERLTGTREMDATAIIDYFAPLMGYLKKQNEGRTCGW
jgi:peptidyl-dipeptidase A